jgi:type IV pilus assembly protein PilY1
MNLLISLCAAALLLLSQGAGAAVTSIAQLPLLNITDTGVVKPNLMLLYDNSGSMASAFTPDYIDDSTTCRAGSLMSSVKPRGCTVGHPPFNSPDFNRQYYNPNVQYTPPVKWDGSSYNSLTRANTNAWTSVTTDAFGINTKDLLGSSNSSTNLVTGFPDIKWCDPNSKTTCGFNSATYTYPTDARTYATVFYTNPYYYTIYAAEFCTTSALTTCKTTAVGAAAPAGYPYPAKVRWCTTTALTTCQAKYVGAYIYPRFSNPNAGVVGAYGTITVGASSTATSMSVTSVSVVESGGTVVITNGAVTAATGTNSTAKEAQFANDLALSIINKTGLTNQYTACVMTPSSGSSVPACSTYGITLGATNIVAVVAIDCTPGATSKAIGQCSLLPDDTRNGWALTVQAAQATVTAAQPATALLKVAGTSSSTNKPVLASLKLGNTTLLTNLQLNTSASSTSIASAIAQAISGTGITAVVGGTAGYSSTCSSATSSSVCVITTVSAAAGQALTVGAISNNTGANGTARQGSIVLTPVSTTAAVGEVTDVIPFNNPAPTSIGAGAAIFVRTDIVPARTTYPKGALRNDCAAATTCSYDEEMTNFANWYGYYKTRNQMMKTSVGQAFQPLTSNYNVGLTSLSTAAVEGTMTVPAPFTGTARTTWYATLYAMNGSDSTPLRSALNAVGRMYANLGNYSNANVVQYPCQQNFTFLTTDGYWNGGAASTVVNNDNVESPSRFCTAAKGCVDPRSQSYNSLADVALYWYNGGSNTGTVSLRPTLDDITKTGQVPVAPGENAHLHMNTYTLGLGVDGIMNFEDDYDTAPIPGGDFYKLITGVSTGCPWNNNGAYVWPDPVTSDSDGSAAYQSRVDDLWHTAINGHGKYFSASDPTQVVAGLRSALSNIATRVGAASAAATSTPNISQQDNDIFSDTFTTVKWYGVLTDKKINVTDGTVNPAEVWNTSNLLGQKVGAATDTRVIKMLDTSTGTLKDFSYASMSTLEKTWFDNLCANLAQCPSLSTANRAVVNAGANIVGWLRGQQQYADDAIMRAYTQTATAPPGLAATVPIVLGDIASSKPAYLRDPRKLYTIAGYSDFKVANAARVATVFAAANDGMLHAFNATTGDEKWAYVPRITMKKLYLQAGTTYGTSHQYTTDGSPEVADVQIAGVWKSVLVAGLNGGGRGYYALDVTDPANPKALWETCADVTVCTGVNNEPELGLTFGNPQIGTWKDATGTTKWVAVVTSGYNNVPGTDGVGTTAANGGTGAGWLMLLDIATGKVLLKTSTGNGNATTPSGFARITAISANPSADPQITFVYGGDNQGQMWRFDLTAQGAMSVVRMGDAGVLQPITTRPDVTQCQVNVKNADNSYSTANKMVVAFGTGRLLDVPDVKTTDTQSLYLLVDSTTGISASQWRSSTMAKETLVTNTVGGTKGFYINGTAVDLSTQQGWYVDFDQNTGERINIDPAIVSGTINVVTNVPSSSSACNVGGSSNLYQVEVCTGLGDSTGLAGVSLSNNSAAVGFIVINLPSGAKKIIATLADGSTPTVSAGDLKDPVSRRSGWRRIKG